VANLKETLATRTCNKNIKNVVGLIMNVCRMTTYIHFNTTVFHKMNSIVAKWESLHNKSNSSLVLHAAATTTTVLLYSYLDTSILVAVLISAFTSSNTNAIVHSLVGYII
jgi:hypothetical protein